VAGMTKATDKTDKPDIVRDISARCMGRTKRTDRTLSLKSVRLSGLSTFDFLCGFKKGLRELQPRTSPEKPLRPPLLVLDWACPPRQKAAKGRRKRFGL
jgi:hypothetical protein